MDDGRHALPPELEARIAALETLPAGTDFEPSSWIWMVSFGIALPFMLIVLGW